MYIDPSVFDGHIDLPEFVGMFYRMIECLTRLGEVRVRLVEYSWFSNR